MLAITNCGSVFKRLLCLRRIMNQKTAKEAINTTATGTTIAGMSMLRLFEEDLVEAFDVAAGSADVDDAAAPDVA